LSAWICEEKNTWPLKFVLYFCLAFLKAKPYSKGLALLFKIL